MKLYINSCSVIIICHIEKSKCRYIIKYEGMMCLLLVKNHYSRNKRVEKDKLITPKVCSEKFRSLPNLISIWSPIMIIRGFFGSFSVIDNWSNWVIRRWKIIGTVNYGRQLRVWLLISSSTIKQVSISFQAVTDDYIKHMFNVFDHNLLYII